MTDDAAAFERSKRKYTKLKLSAWAEIEALWQAGEVTLTELSERFGISSRTLQAHFQKHRITKGEKASALISAVQEEILKEQLDNKDLTLRRAKDVREAAYRDSVTVQTLIMAQLENAQKDPGQALKAASAIKMLTLAAAGLERLHDLKWRALGLDRDSIFQDEMPELVVRVLTDEEAAEMRAAQMNEDFEDEVSEDDELTGAGDPTDEEIVIENGEECERRPSQDRSVPADAEGYRLVRDAKG